MNFQRMWSVLDNNHSDLLYVSHILACKLYTTEIASSRFWEIAIPLMIVVISVFLWRDVVSMLHFLKKKILVAKVQKVRG